MTILYKCDCGCVLCSGDYVVVQNVIVVILYSGDYVVVEGDPDTSQTLIDLILNQELGPSPPQCVLKFLYYLHVSLDSGDGFIPLKFFF